MGEGDVPRIVAPPDETTRALEGALAGYLPFSMNASLGIIVNGRTYYRATGPDAAHINPDSLFEIGSVTKTFIGVALAQAILERKVSLNDPLQPYLPSGIEMPTHNGSVITFGHMATHTSGLPKDPEDVVSGILDYLDLFNAMANYDLQRAAVCLAAHRLKRAPGALFHYSNFFGLIGYALATIDGRSWQQTVIDRVCNPLGMNDTRQDLDDRQADRFVPGHGVLLPQETRTHWGEDSLIAPAAALKSSARDLLKYLAAQLGLQESPLRKAIELSHASQFTVTGRVAGSDGIIDLLSTPPAMDEIGIAWWINKTPEETIISHGGATGGYMAMVKFAPRRKCGFVLLVDRLRPGMGPISDAVMEVVLEQCRS